MEPIFHITTFEEWLEAQRVGRYEGDTLKTDGFIHFSYVHQVADVANLTFRGKKRGLIVLEVDPDLLDVQLRVENGFPHVYGPIRIESVVDVHDFSPEPDGSFAFP